MTVEFRKETTRAERVMHALLIVAGLIGGVVLLLTLPIVLATITFTGVWATFLVCYFLMRLAQKAWGGS